MRRRREPPTHVELRTYLVDVAGRFHDLRGRRGTADFDPVYDLDDYGVSQALARELRHRDADGVCYDSVHRRYQWNGEKIDAVYEIRRLEPGYTARRRLHRAR